MYDICYGGKCASELEVYAVDRPNIPAARKKMNSMEIAGRDGTLYEEEEVYEEQNIEIQMNYIGAEEDWADRWRMVQEWLSKRNASLILSDDPNYFFRISKVDLDNNERSSRRTGKFKATFVSKDGLYYLQDGLAEYSCEAVQYNPYLLTYPTYHINGKGTCELLVNGNSFSMNVSGELYIDTERRLAYMPDGTVVNRAVTGDYEDLYLLPGENVVEHTEGFQVQIIPNWRRL